jgi:hypothetical protein
MYNGTDNPSKVQSHDQACALPRPNSCDLFRSKNY